jgi:hypothetical protein
MRPDEH